MPLISVIVPSYNKAQYIEQCLLSILDNTFKDIELIIIDDKSTDKSNDIIRNVINSHPDRNIRFIENQENLGPGLTRHNAINMAKGEWISLIDADDYILSDYYEKLLEYQKKSKADAVYSRALILDGDNLKKDDSQYSKEIVLTNKHMWVDNLGLLGLQYLCRALIRKKSYDKIGGYCKSRYIEDTPTAISLFSVLKSVHITPYFGYVYRILNDSIIHSMDNLKVSFYLCYNTINAIELIKKDDEKLAEHICSAAISSFQNKAKKGNLKYYDYLDAFRKEFEEMIEYYGIKKESIE